MATKQAPQGSSNNWTDLLISHSANGISKIFHKLLNINAKP